MVAPSGAGDWEGIFSDRTASDVVSHPLASGGPPTSQVRSPVAVVGAVSPLVERGVVASPVRDLDRVVEEHHNERLDLWSDTCCTLPVAAGVGEVVMLKSGSSCPARPAAPTAWVGTLGIMSISASPWRSESAQRFVDAKTAVGAEFGHGARHDSGDVRCLIRLSSIRLYRQAVIGRLLRGADQPF